MDGTHLQTAQLWLTVFHRIHFDILSLVCSVFVIVALFMYVWYSPVENHGAAVWCRYLVLHLDSCPMYSAVIDAGFQQTCDHLLQVTCKLIHWTVSTQSTSQLRQVSTVLLTPHIFLWVQDKTNGKFLFQMALISTNPKSTKLCTS